MRKNSILRRLPVSRLKTETWPLFDASALPAEHQDEYRRRTLAITALVRGSSYHEIERETQVRPDHLKYLFARCSALDDSGEIFGFRALVPGNRRISTYARKSEIDRSERDGRGHCSGALTQLLNNYPSIKASLIQRMLGKGNAKRIADVKPPITEIHRYFLKLCEEQELKARGVWPFNTLTFGETSIRNFVRTVFEERPGAFTSARHGEVAKTMMRTGTGIKGLLSDPPSIYDVIGIDEVTLDCIATVTVPVPGGGFQDIAIERIHIVLVVEKKTRSILSWHAFFSTSVSASDMRQAIQKALSPWEPMKFSLPLEYMTADAGMPSGLFPVLAYQGWTTLWLDNAFGHQDRKMLSDLNELLGPFVNLGPVRQWYRRGFLNRQIKKVLISSARRLPSTTGGHPEGLRRSLQTRLPRR